jgi:FkbM family methyltransferase
MPVGYAQGKWLALKALATQARFFTNWNEVFSAYRAGRNLPPLRLRSGLTLYHAPNDDIWALFEEIFVARCYSRPDFFNPRPDQCVLDCGANVGTFAIYLQSVAPGIRVNCFEPAASTRRRLQENITANHLDGLVQIHPFAVFDHEGELKLPQAAFAGSSSFFDTQAPQGAVETVQCTTLSHAVALCGSAPIDLLKIDVEGAELEILESTEADNPTLWESIPRVVMEYHEAIRPGCRDRLMALLRPHYPNVEAWPTSPNGGLGIIQATRLG